MREYVNFDVLVNWVTMLRADIDGAICLADDEEEGRFYESWIHDTARVVPTPQVAVGLLTTVAERGVEGVVATVREGDGSKGDRNGIFRPGLGDVSSLLLVSRTAERAIEQVCGGPWMKAADKAVGSLRGRGIHLARVLGKWRAASGISMSPDRLEEFVDWRVLELNWEEMQHASAAAGSSAAGMEEWRKISESDGLDDAVRDCDGRDAVYLLAAATRRYHPRGLRPLKEVSGEELTTMLRIGFDAEDLIEDEMFWRMRQWEYRNQQFPLLGEWRSLDPLGVLLDQRYWERDLGRMIRLLPPPLAAFKMDLDNFSSINESLGHSGGDEAIRLYCTIVREVLGRIGEVYRRGGDEVVAFAPGISASQAAELAEMIRGRIEAKFRQFAEERGLPGGPTASIGVIWLEGPVVLSEVVRQMDSAQQRAKDEGKNRVVAV